MIQPTFQIKAKQKSKQTHTHTNGRINRIRKYLWCLMNAKRFFFSTTKKSCSNIYTNTHTHTPIMKFGCSRCSEWDGQKQKAWIAKLRRKVGAMHDEHHIKWKWTFECFQQLFQQNKRNTNKRRTKKKRKRLLSPKSYCVL